MTAAGSVAACSPPGSLRALAAVAVTMAVAGGCMPWTVGQPATTVPSGTTVVGAGVGGLVDHREWDAPVPVPQLWVRRGVGERTDLGVSYALPGTLFGDLKRRIGPGVRTRAALTGGVGLHTILIPEDLGGGGVGWIPFLAGGLLVDRGGTGNPDAEQGGEEEASGSRNHFSYAHFRAFVPFHVGDGAAATLWVAPSVGWHRAGERRSWGPELGVVVPATRPSRWFFVGAVSLRWG